MRHKHLLAILVIAVAAGMIFAGCGGGGDGGGEITITISPASANVATGSTQVFTATVAGTGNKNVNWSILEGSAGGTIEKTGTSTALYTAPQVWNIFHIVATSAADPTKTATAIVRVGPPLPPD